VVVEEPAVEEAVVVEASGEEIDVAAIT